MRPLRCEAGRPCSRHGGAQDQVLTQCTGPSVAVVGELNPYGADPRYALYHEPEGASGDRLRRILGLTVRSYVALSKYNLCVGKWSAPLARLKALAIWEDHRTIVVLGSKVRSAFDRLVGKPLDKPPITRYHDESGHVLIWLPHPSGLNRMWNDRINVLRSRELVETHAGIPPEVEEFLPPPDETCACGAEPPHHPTSTGCLIG